jgi:hypothetical protein
VLPAVPVAAGPPTPAGAGVAGHVNAEPDRGAEAAGVTGVRILVSDRTWTRADAGAGATALETAAP